MGTLSASRILPHSGAGTPERTRGDEPPERWVLLRGLGREARHWFDFPERLSEALGVPSEAVDLPGLGGGRYERAPSSVALTAETLAHRLRGTLRARTGVIGLSYGGMVALELCRVAPQWFSHAVVVNTSSRLSPPWLRLFPRGLALITESLLTRDVLARERLIYELTSNLGSLNARRLARLAAPFAETSPVSRRVVMAQLAAAARFQPPDIDQPVLVLSSKADRMVSSSCSMDLATRLGALHLSHQSGGHDLPLDASDWVIASILGWLESSDSRPLFPDALSLARDDLARPSSPPLV